MFNKFLLIFLLSLGPFVPFVPFVPFAQAKTVHDVFDEYVQQASEIATGQSKLPVLKKLEETKLSEIITLLKKDKAQFTLKNKQGQNIAMRSLDFGAIQIFSKLIQLNTAKKYWRMKDNNGLTAIDYLTKLGSYSELACMARPDRKEYADNRFVLILFISKGLYSKLLDNFLNANLSTNPRTVANNFIKNCKVPIPEVIAKMKELSTKNSSKLIQDYLTSLFIIKKNGYTLIEINAERTIEEAREKEEKEKQKQQAEAEFKKKQEVEKAELQKFAGANDSIVIGAIELKFSKEKNGMIVSRIDAAKSASLVDYSDSKFKLKEGHKVTSIEVHKVKTLKDSIAALADLKARGIAQADLTIITENDGQIAVNMVSNIPID